MLDLKSFNEGAIELNDNEVFHNCSFSCYANISDALSVLKEYEDIGLTAEEIKSFLSDFGATVTKRNRALIKELQKYRELKMNNKLVELECKIGDIVYEANMNRNIVSSYRVKSITLMEESRYYNWELVSGIYSNLIGFNELEIGEVVFLTHKEAEEAL